MIKQYNIMKKQFNDYGIKDGYSKIHKSYWLVSVEADKNDISYDQFRAYIVACNRMRDNWYNMWCHRISNYSILSSRAQSEEQFLVGLYAGLCALSEEIDSGFRSGSFIHQLDNKEKYREFIQSINKN